MNSFDTDAIDPFADDTIIHADDTIDPFADPTDTTNPLDNTDIPENLSLEEESRLELEFIKQGFDEADARHRAEVKLALRQQDQNQRQQFRNLYDANYYFSEVYKTADECERAKKIQARILGIDYEEAGFGFYRRGDMVMKAFKRLATQLNIDISDL